MKQGRSRSQTLARPRCYHNTREGGGKRLVRKDTIGPSKIGWAPAPTSRVRPETPLYAKARQMLSSAYSPPAAADGSQASAQMCPGSSRPACERH